MQEDHDFEINLDTLVYFKSDWLQSRTLSPNERSKTRIWVDVKTQLQDSSQAFSKCACMMHVFEWSDMLGSLPLVFFYPPPPLNQSLTAPHQLD